MIETDSMKCCKFPEAKWNLVYLYEPLHKCPDPDPTVNKTYCTDLVCVSDGKTYKGICALKACGNTVSNQIIQ